MLLMKPNCECCDKDLAAGTQGAMICSFECTFCDRCAETRFFGRCPNCSGPLARRPVREAAALSRFPASADRVLKPHAPCLVDVWSAAGIEGTFSLQGRFLPVSPAPASGADERTHP